MATGSAQGIAAIGRIKPNGLIQPENRLEKEASLFSLYAPQVRGV